MSWLEAVIFGAVQGLTEFIPVSSSAHLVITQYLFGFHFPGLSYEICLHLASVVAVIAYFRKDIRKIASHFFTYLLWRSPAYRSHFYFALYIIIATGITAVLGVSLQSAMGEKIKDPRVVAFGLALTAFFLVLIEKYRRYGSRTEGDMRWFDSLLVGLGQSIAVFPGVSRSGASLIASLWIGLNRDTAVRYSFLLMVPVILGSSVLAIPDIESGKLLSQIGLGPFLLSFLVSLISSWIGICWLIFFLQKSRLSYFAVYCFCLALFVFFYFDPEMVFEVAVKKN